MGHPYPRKLEPIVVGSKTIYMIRLHARWIWEGKQLDGLSFSPPCRSPVPSSSHFSILLLDTSFDLGTIHQGGSDPQPGRRSDWRGSLGLG